MFWLNGAISVAFGFKGVKHGGVGLRACELRLRYANNPSLITMRPTTPYFRAFLLAQKYHSTGRADAWLSRSSGRTSMRTGSPPEYVEGSSSPPAGPSGGLVSSPFSALCCSVRDSLIATDRKPL